MSNILPKYLQTRKKPPSPPCISRIPGGKVQRRRSRQRSLMKNGWSVVEVTQKSLPTKRRFGAIETSVQTASRLLFDVVFRLIVVCHDHVTFFFFSPPFVFAS